jgi:hypothetical protein
MRPSLLIAAVVLLSAGRVSAQTATDSAGVRAAVSDYIEGFYKGDTLRFVRSIRKDVHKIGIVRDDATGRYRRSLMNWKYFMESAEEVRNGTDKEPPNAQRKIELLDLTDQVAVAKLTAMWGIDYLTLAKDNGRWTIQQVMGGPHPARR